MLDIIIYHPTTSLEKNNYPTGSIADKKMNDFIKKFKEYEKQINIMLNVDYVRERN